MRLRLPRSCHLLSHTSIHGAELPDGSSVSSTGALLKGLSGLVTVTSAGSKLGWINVPLNSTVTGLIIGTTTHEVLRKFQAGVMLPDGSAAADQRFQFFASDAAVPKLTEDGWRLFDAYVAIASGLGCGLSVCN